MTTALIAPNAVAAATIAMAIHGVPRAGRLSGSGAARSAAKSTGGGAKGPTSGLPHACCTRRERRRRLEWVGRDGGGASSPGEQRGGIRGQWYARSLGCRTPSGGWMGWRERVRCGDWRVQCGGGRLRVLYGRVLKRGNRARRRCRCVRERTNGARYRGGRVRRAINRVRCRGGCVRRAINRVRCRGGCVRERTNGVRCRGGCVRRAINRVRCRGGRAWWCRWRDERAPSSMRGLPNGGRQLRKRAHRTPLVEPLLPHERVLGDGPQCCLAAHFRDENRSDRHPVDGDVPLVGCAQIRHIEGRRLLFALDSRAKCSSEAADRCTGIRRMRGLDGS